jgi:hypothetical protein
MQTTPVRPIQQIVLHVGEEKMMVCGNIQEASSQLSTG